MGNGHKWGRDILRQTDNLTTHPVSVGHDGVDGGVQGAQFDLALELCGGLCPVRGQALAVAAPGSVELHQNHPVVLQHLFIKVAVSDLHHVLGVARLNNKSKHSVESRSKEKKIFFFLTFCICIFK